MGASSLLDILTRTSYHAVYDDSIIEALQFARASGFAGVQVGVEAPHLSPEHLSAADLDAVGCFCAEEGLRVSLHGPDYAVSMCETDRHLRRGAAEYLSALFDAGQRMACGAITLHFGQMPAWGTATTPAATLAHQDVIVLKAALRDNLRKLVDLADGRFTICMENFGLNELAQEAVEPFLRAKELALCWDLAKSNGDQELEGFLWRHIASVRQVHLHDIAEGRSHQVIGTGTLDIAKYLPRLAAHEVKDFCLEVRPREKAVESLRNLGRILLSLTGKRP